MKSIKKLKAFIFNKLHTELPIEMYFHNVWHTKNVLNQCNNYIRRLKINSDDAFILRTAALMHDVGVIKEHKNHEQYGIEYCRKILPEWNYTNKQIDAVCELISSTTLPQKPKNMLEKVICDADLDYLGTNSFFEKSILLRDEFIYFKIVNDINHWQKYQLNFLKSHVFHTDFAKKYREPIKQKNLKKIISS